MDERGFDLSAVSGARPARGPVFRVVLRCAGCSASETILTTRAGLAGWTSRTYQCGACVPTNPVAPVVLAGLEVAA